MSEEHDLTCPACGCDLFSCVLLREENEYFQCCDCMARIQVKSRGEGQTGLGIKNIDQDEFISWKDYHELRLPPVDLELITSRRIKDWLGLVTVQRVSLNLGIYSNKKDLEKAFWYAFANKNYWKEFRGIRLADWLSAWSSFSGVLVDKARTLDLPWASLQMCLDTIAEPVPVEEILVPIAAFLISNGSEDVWAIICIGERLKGLENSDTWPSHLSMWAISASSGSIIAQKKCL
jgi:hypothetical protein